MVAFFIFLSSLLFMLWCLLDKKIVAQDRSPVVRNYYMCRTIPPG
jgi:hypothetical protein